MLEIGVRLPAMIGDVGEYLADAAALEAAGVESLWVGEQSVLPVAATSRPAPDLDPWVLLAGIAAVTHRARLGTAVSSIAAWPPVLFATMATSLDHLSRGRLVVGGGVGNHPVRFVAGGLSARERGRRLEEFVTVVRAIWSGSREPFRGEYYDVPALEVAEPRRPGGPPIVLGARGRAGFLRAARWGDGLIHPGGRPDEVASALAQVLEFRKGEGRSGPFESWTLVPAPAGRAEWRQTLEAYGATGLTGLIVAWDPRLLDLLRNPDAEVDRSDLALAQG